MSRLIYSECLKTDLCSVGDNIYYYDTAGKIYEERVVKILKFDNFQRIDLSGGLEFSSCLLHNRFFLTREEAEQALKECNDNRCGTCKVHKTGELLVKIPSIADMPNPKDDTDKMCNAIHKDTTANADKIGR